MQQHSISAGREHPFPEPRARGLVSVSLALVLMTTSLGAQVEKMKAYTETIDETKVKIEMVPIKAGTGKYPASFRLGSAAGEEGRKDDEGPPVEVAIEPFWMARCEITWDTYNVFRNEYSIMLDRKLERSSTPKAAWADAVSLPTPLWEQDSAPILQGMGVEGGYPVADISQFAAMQFTKWLSKKTGHFYRLPTEAEWEYAARAGTRTVYFFGDDPEELGKYAWTFDNAVYDDPEKGFPGAGAGYRKVGLKLANPWGLHDIYGNVSEWVLDQYNKDGYAHVTGEKANWKTALRLPTEIFPCVTRGGNWDSDPTGCRSAARLPSNREWQDRDPQIPKSIWWYTDAFHVGFRIVRPLEAPAPAERNVYWDPKTADIEEVLTEGGKQVRVAVKPEKEEG